MVPVLLSAVLVFIASSLIHMFTPWHRGNGRALPGEAEALEALRRLKVSPGDYVMPHAGSMEAMRDPGFRARLEAGPAVFLTVWKGSTSMAPQLAGWFLYSVLVSVFAGYLAGAAVGPGAARPTSRART